MTESQLKLQKLHRKVFVFDTSDADEKIFKITIQNWFIQNSRQSFTQMLWEIIWIRNDKGKFSKYLFFNERSQKLFLDRDFLEWAKLTLNEMELMLKNIPTLHTSLE